MCGDKYDVIWVCSGTLAQILDLVMTLLTSLGKINGMAKKESKGYLLMIKCKSKGILEVLQAKQIIPQEYSAEEIEGCSRKEQYVAYLVEMSLLSFHRVVPEHRACNQPFSLGVRCRKCDGRL